MITDRELVEAAAATYSCAPTWQGVGFAQSVHACRSELRGVTIVAFRGSREPADWAFDFLALPELWHRAGDQFSLGLIHAGFLTAARSVIIEVERAVRGVPYVLTGHSLGAALALLIGALLDAAGCPPQKIAAFAPPRVGCAPFVRALGCLTVSAYRFGNDPVPLVPIRIPLAPYQQIPLTRVGHDMPDSLKCHAIENYLAAVAEPAPA